MSFLQGGALPDVKETTTSTTTPTSTEYGNLLNRVSGAGATNIGRTGAESVAAYDPLQTQGYGMVPGAATAYQPGLNAAQATAGRAAQGVTPGRIQAMMNPYTTNVVNELGRLSQQNVERNLMPTMRSAFVGTGGLGSKRYADAMGQTMADVQSDLRGQQFGALSKGYTEALKGALDEAQLLNTTAKTQGDLSRLQQDLGLTGAGALNKAGGERQAYEQAILDAPMRNAKASADLLRGYTMPSTETKTFTGPRTKDYYQLSDAARLGGLATFVGSAQGGKGIDVLKNAGTSLFDYLTGKRNTIDLGGGLTMKFDKSGAPTIEGGSGYLPTDDPMAQIYKDAGFTMDETGTYYMPGYQPETSLPLDETGTQYMSGYQPSGSNLVGSEYLPGFANSNFANVYNPDAFLSDVYLPYFKNSVNEA
jgi:hypothetical protein